MKILVDAFGGDNSPSEVIKGAVEAVNGYEGFEVVLIGKEEVVNERLKEYTYDASRISVVDARDVITCEEEPTVAIKRKPDSSLCVAFKMLKENEDCAALVSAGSTGAVLVGATLKVGRLPGLSRPALCPVLPTLTDKKVLLLDCGANADCKPNFMLDFAILGNEYAKCALGVKNPKVALLSNGTEDKKGNTLIHETFPLLKEQADINFVGNMEAREILSGDYDVVVSDGFSGNVALKATEGAVKVILKSLKNVLYKNVKTKIAGALIKKDMTALKNKLDYSKAGGAIFLGVNKLIIKCHGSSMAETIRNSIIQAVDVTNTGVIEELKKAFLAKLEGKNNAQ